MRSSSADRNLSPYHVGGRQESHVGQVEDPDPGSDAGRSGSARDPSTFRGQRRAGVAAVVRADLVDFRAERARTGFQLDFPAPPIAQPTARPRARIGTPVPRFSASSRTSAKATRTTCGPGRGPRSSPIDVLPTPGGPAQRHHGPGPRRPTTCRATLGPTGHDRQVFDDGPYIVSTVVIGAQVARAPGVGAVGAPVRSFHGDRGRCPDQVRIPAASGSRRWPVPACRPHERGLAHVVGRIGGLDAGTVIVDAVGSPWPSSLRITAASC